MIAWWNTESTVTDAGSLAQRHGTVIRTMRCYSEAEIDDLIQASDKALDTRLAAPLRVVTGRLPYLSPVTSPQASDLAEPRVPYT